MKSTTTILPFIFILTAFTASGVTYREVVVVPGEDAGPVELKVAALLEERLNEHFSQAAPDRHASVNETKPLRILLGRPENHPELRGCLERFNIAPLTPLGARARRIPPAPHPVGGGGAAPGRRD